MTAYRFFDFFAAFFAFFAFFAIGLIPPFRLGYAEGEPRHRVASAAWHSASACRLPFSLRCARYIARDFVTGEKVGQSSKATAPLERPTYFFLAFLAFLAAFFAFFAIVPPEGSSSRRRWRPRGVCENQERLSLTRSQPVA